jgi:hypothetical protein
MAKQDKLDRVPPYMPIVCCEWKGNRDIQRMTVAEEGFFVRFLLKQWELGDLPADPWLLSRLLNTNYRTTDKWLQKYSHLTVKSLQPRSEHAASLHQECSKCAVSLHNEKLKNYGIDVNLGLPLGTTEPNLTETSPKVTPTCAPFGGEGAGGVSSSVVDEYLGQGKPTPCPLVDDLVQRLGVKTPDPEVYSTWSRRL